MLINGVDAQVLTKKVFKEEIFHLCINFLFKNQEFFECVFKLSSFGLGVNVMLIDHSIWFSHVLQSSELLSRARGAYLRASVMRKTELYSARGVGKQ